MEPAWRKKFDDIPPPMIRKSASVGRIINRNLKPIQKIKSSNVLDVFNDDNLESQEKSNLKIILRPIISAQPRPNSNTIHIKQSLNQFTSIIELGSCL